MAAVSVERTIESFALALMASEIDQNRDERERSIHSLAPKIKVSHSLLFLTCRITNPMLRQC